MKPDFDKMTLDELRDWVARDDGYTPGFGGWYQECGEAPASFFRGHPVPSTIDAAAAAMPDRYELKFHTCANGWHGSVWLHDEYVAEADDHSEIALRFRLACKCRWVEKEAQR